MSRPPDGQGRPPAHPMHHRVPRPEIAPGRAPRSMAREFHADSPMTNPRLFRSGSRPGSPGCLSFLHLFRAPSHCLPPAGPLCERGEPGFVCEMVQLLETFTAPMQASNIRSLQARSSLYIKHSQLTSILEFKYVRTFRASWSLRTFASFEHSGIYHHS